MVSWSIFWEHATALLLVWAAVAVAGFALLPVLRLRVGLPGVPLLGVVYWTVALYLLPFVGGLDIAAGFVAVLTGIAGVRWWQDGAPRPIWTRPSWSMLILLIGSLPYITTLLYHYVPFGMDASMHATAATLIGRSGGLPSSYAPFTPDLAFPPMNLGLSTVAGVAIRWGGEPAAVMLACHHLTFTVLIVATYLLLRWWTDRTSAALLAVVSVWMARGTQASLGWGGFPTVMSVAVGLFAARLLLQHGRGTNLRLAFATGASVAAIPLIHGVGAGTWLYCVAPWIALAALAQSKHRGATLRGFALSGLMACGFLLAYVCVGTIDVQVRDMEWTRQWQEESAPLGANAWLGALGFIRKDSGSLIVLAGWAALGVLLVRRQWRAAGLLTAAWLALSIVVANVRWWILPASFLLYAERAIYWAAPLSAVALTLAWRSLPADWQRPTRWTGALALGVLIVAAYSQNQFYQKIVREDFVNQDGWEALLWAKHHLQPERDFVQTAYNSTGSFLPAVAQIGCTGSHHHHFIARQVQSAYGRRAVTHQFIDQTRTPGTQTPVGTVVFRNRTITMTKLVRD